MSWFDKLYQTFIVGDRYMWLVDGLKNTLIITLGALLIGVIIGSIIAVVKVFCEDNKKLRAFSWLCDIYTTVIRGIPVTVLLLVFFFIVFASADIIFRTMVDELEAASGSKKDANAKEEAKEAKKEKKESKKEKKEE